MLKIPLQDIIEKIKQEKGLSEEEINFKIKQKLDQLSGLISKEGAAHIIANELGVKIFEQMQGKLQIKNILSGMRNLETVGKVTRLFELREFQTQNGTGKVASYIIGDETGTIRVVMWGNQAETISKINEGNIIKISGAYVRENQGRKEIHVNDRSKLLINPEGETIGEVKQENNYPKPEKKAIKDLTEDMENIEILGTIVQVFELRFFETCPECGKRAAPEGDKFVCPVHSAVAPNYSYVMNVFLDDGTENVRCVFFKNQINNLLKKQEQDILRYKDDPQSFEQIKTHLLGNIIKVIGKSSKNQMFDRLEFVAQLVFPNPDPDEEIKNLEDHEKHELSSAKPIHEHKEVQAEQTTTSPNQTYTEEDIQ